MLDLSIVIIGYKSRGLVKNCLNSIYTNLANSKLNYKIVIVENASNDGTIELVRDKYPQVKLIALNKNSGYSKAVNLGIRTFEAKYYFVLNPDTLFTQEKSIDDLYNFMEANPEVGLAGPKLVNPDGSTQMSCCKFPPFLIPIYRRTKLGKIKRIADKIDDYLMKNWDHQQTSFVDWVIGTGMFVRHQALEKVGLMDERFFMYFEDTDWCHRFWDAGWKVCYVANIEVIHYHGRPSLKHGGIMDLFFNKSTRVHITSWLKYFSKYTFKLNSKINSNNMERENEAISFDSEQFDIARNKSISAKNKKKSWLSYVVIGILVILAIALVYFFTIFLQVKKYAVNAKTDIETSYQNFINLDFVASNKSLESSRANIEKAQAKVTKLKPLTFINSIDQNYQAVNVLLSSIADFTHTFEIVNNWAETNITPIKNSTAGSISQMNSNDKENLLQSISAMDPTLRDIYSGTRLTREKLATIETEEINSKVAEVVNDFDGKLEKLESSVLLAQDVLPVAIARLGYPQKQTYLFLLQNNGEVRATGGYLGTYGVFEIENGEFIKFNTDNTYNLDTDNVARLNTQAPAPIQKYLGSSKWVLRDANWSPDLTVASSKIEELYKLESRDERNLDGLVVMDPMPIVDLLAVTGPITVDDVTFDSDNFVDSLEYYTYEGFAEEGVSSRNRKDLIGKLGVEMIDYFFNSSLDKWAIVWNIVSDNLNEKHIMFNFKDSQAQNLVTRQNWNDQVKNTAGDFLMVVDSSMGSLKTDRFTDKKIQYTVSYEAGKYIGQVDLNYYNSAKLTEKTGDLREYTRIYVPEDAKLIGVIGSEEPIDSSKELNKSAFGTFWTVPMGEARKLTFRYELPARLFEASEYSLLAQKQAGTIAHDFGFNFNLENIKETYQTDLNLDKDFIIKLR